MRHFNSEKFRGGKFSKSPITSTCRILTPKHRAAKISGECAAPQGCCFLSFPKFFMWFWYIFIKIRCLKSLHNLLEVCIGNICKLKDLLIFIKLKFQRKLNVSSPPQVIFNFLLYSVSTFIERYAQVS